MFKQPVKMRNLFFAALLALGILPVMVLMAALAPGVLHAYQSAAAERSLGAAQGRAAELIQRLERRRETVRNIAMLPAPLEILRAVQGEGAGLYLNVQQAAERFNGVIRRWFNPAGDMRQLVLLDPKGTELLRLESLGDTVVSVPPGESVRAELAERFAKALAEGTEPEAVILPDLATLRLYTGIRALDGSRAGVLMMDFDLHDVFRDYATSLWVSGAGRYLHPAGAGDAFQDFPALRGADGMLVADGPSGVGAAWVPLRLGTSAADRLWIGTPVDEGELRRGLTLLAFSGGLVFALVAGGLLIGVHLLTRAVDRRKQELVSGVGKIMAGQPGVRFDWPWPAELRDFGMELTQLGEMHREAVRSLRLTRFSVEHAGEAIFWIAADGRILYVNDAACALLGHARPALLNLTIPLVNPTDGQNWGDLWHSLRKAGCLTFETTLRRADGTLLPVEVAANHMLFEGEEFNFAFVRDISERKAAADKMQAMVDELTRSNAELERFAYVAAHDLQEPVRTVVSFAQLLERRLAKNLEQDDRENLGFLVSGARRMHALVQDLLTYAQVKRADTPLAAVDSGLAADLAVAALRQLIDETGASLSVAPLPRVVADTGQLAQVFQNLLGNALKFTRPGIVPSVRVWADRQGDEWVFAVADNGIGIEPEYADQLFTLFRRLNGQRYPGTGLGLAVSRTIVERLGGRIWFESAPGEGTTFRFSLRAA